MLVSLGVSIPAIALRQRPPAGGTAPPTDPTPPAGYVFVVDSDGAYLTDADGAYLIVEA